VSFRLYVCPIDRPQQWRAAGLLLGAPVQRMSIDNGGRPAATATQQDAAAANAGDSVTFTAAWAG